MMGGFIVITFGSSTTVGSGAGALTGDITWGLSLADVSGFLATLVLLLPVFDLTGASALFFVAVVFFTVDLVVAVFFVLVAFSVVPDFFVESEAIS
jgi:hypothetical protein